MYFKSGLVSYYVVATNKWNTLFVVHVGKKYTIPYAIMCDYYFLFSVFRLVL